MLEERQWQGIYCPKELKNLCFWTYMYCITAGWYSSGLGGRAIMCLRAWMDLHELSDEEPRAIEGRE